MRIANRLPSVLSANGHVQGARAAVETAEQRSRRNVYHARAKLMQTALVRFVGLAYETFDDDTRLLANVDPDGRLRVGVPWSWRQYQSYGLRRGEADALRWEMTGRSLPEIDHVALFERIDDLWYLNRHGYPTAGDGFRYLEDYPDLVAGTCFI